MPLAADAEGRARHARDVLALQQARAEFLAGKARWGDRGEDVEGAPRLEAGKAHLVEAGDHQPAAAVVGADHRAHILKARLKRAAERAVGGHLALN